MTDFNAIRARHVRVYVRVFVPFRCVECGKDWPCDFIIADDTRRQLVEAAQTTLRAFAGETIRLGPGSKGEALRALRDALAESES